MQYRNPKPVLGVLILSLILVQRIGARVDTHLLNPPDSTEIKKMNDEAFDLIFSNPELAAIKIDSAIYFSRQVGFVAGEIDGLGLQAGIQMQIYGNFDGALVLFNKAIVLAEKHGKTKELQSLRANIGVLSIEMGNYDLAEVRIKEMLEEGLMRRDTSDIVTSLSNLGALYNRKGQFDEAIGYLKKAENICGTNCKPEKIVHILQNIAGIYIGLRMYKEALTYSQRAVPLLDSTVEYLRYPLINVMATSLINLDSIEQAKLFLDEIKEKSKSEKSLYYYHYNYASIFSDQPDSSAYHINQLVAISEKKKSKYDLGVALIQKSALQRKKGEYKHSERSLRKAEKILSASNSLIDKVELAKEKFLLELARENPNSISLFKNYEQLSDSMRGQKLRSTVIGLELEYNIRSKQDSILLLVQKQESMALRQETQKNRNTLLSVIAFVMLILVLMIFSFFIITKRKNTIIGLRSDQVETLKTEMNHRVRNNLQMLSSFMSLQSLRSSNHEVKNVLDVGKNRIQAMADVHQQLQDNESGGKVDAEVYFKTLIDRIQFSLASDKKILINLNVNNLQLSMKEATRLGLILNELLTNLMKHGYPAEDYFLIVDLSLFSRNDNEILMVLKENGVGLPSNIEFNKSKGLGLKLIGLLSKQLGGTYSYRKADKNIFELTYFQK